MTDTKSSPGQGESGNLATRLHDTRCLGETPVNGVLSLTPSHLPYLLVPAPKAALHALQATSLPKLGRLEHPSSATNAGGVALVAESVLSLSQQAEFFDLELSSDFMEDLCYGISPLQGHNEDCKWDDTDMFATTLQSSANQPLEGDSSYRPSCARTIPGCPPPVAMFVDATHIWEVARIAHGFGGSARLARTVEWEYVERCVLQQNAAGEADLKYKSTVA